jgi:hypothetical protein
VHCAYSACRSNSSAGQIHLLASALEGHARIYVSFVTIYFLANRSSAVTVLMQELKQTASVACLLCVIGESSSDLPYGDRDLLTFKCVPARAYALHLVCLANVRKCLSPYGKSKLDSPIDKARRHALPSVFEYY